MPAGSIADLAGIAELSLRLSDTMADVHRRGWCDGTGGNFSCTLSRDPVQLLMAPSGIDKGAVSPDDLILVDASGCVLQGRGKPSAETALHLAIVSSRQAGAVLHTHSQAGTLLSRHHGPVAEQEVSYVEIEQLEMLKGLEGIRSHNSCIRLPILANDQDLERLSRRALPHLADAPYGLLLAGHGLYAWGSDLAQARRHLEILEFLLEQQWRQLLLNALLAATHPTPGRDSQVSPLS
jgi:methylthioribulose-1-phosphate dehydratase